MILSVSKLCKDYGRLRALDSVSFTLEPGRILGLMGPNGSGKTTLLKILAGLLRPSSGSAEICGGPLGVASKQLVAYMHDANPLFPWMRAADAIDFYSDFFPDFDTAKAASMLEFMQLERQQRIKAMSKGMLEKLNLALTFSRRAKLFLLDEPLGGIDPLARTRIVNAIVETYNPESSLVISTHLLNDIESMFNDVLFISRGRVLAWGSAEEFRTANGSIENAYVKLFSQEETQE